jgi:hypothetical protein
MSYALYLVSDDSRDFVESCTEYKDAKAAKLLLEEDIASSEDEDYPPNYRVVIVEEP